MILHIIQNGGFVLLLLVIVASLIVTLILERLVFFHRQYIDSDEFIDGVRTVLKRGNVVEALSICDATPGPVARVVKTAIIHRSRNVDQLQNMLFVASLNETTRLEEKLGALVTLVKVAPLIGFWGVILGLMDVLQATLISDAPSRPDQLASGMWRALICSGFGIAISIPGRVGCEYLIQRLRRFVVEIEKSCVEIIIVLKESCS